MTCDPNTLSQLSSCLRCLTDAQLMQVKTSLLCRWLNVAGNVTTTGNFRITELLDIRSTEAGDLRIVN